MKKIDSVNNSKAVLGLFSGLKSRITSIKPVLYQVITPMLFVAFGLFGVNESAWAGQAYVYAYSDPQDGGYVYVATSNSAPSSYSQKSHVASQGGFMSSGNKTFYLFYKCKDNYVFKGWKKVDAKETIQDSNSTDNSTQGWKVTQSATGFGEQASYYNAIFACCYPNTPSSGSSLEFEDVNVGELSNESTIKINHAHAGTITITQSGDVNDFLVTSSSGATINTTEISSFESKKGGVKNIYVKFVPQNNGLRTCTLTVSCSDFTTMTYYLKGTGYNKPSITWVDGNGVELTSGETTLSAGDVLRASCTTGQSVSYSDFISSYFTAGTDGEGNPILTVREDISGTINNLSVTANLAKNTSTYYAAYSEAFTLNVTNLTPQEIEWTDDIADLSNENMPYTITLSAVAKNAKTGAASGLPVTYSMASNASLSLSGNVLTVRALGGPVAITASVAGNESYAPASVTKYATVINMTDPCATSDNHSGGTLNRDSKNFDIYPTVPKQLTFRVTKSSIAFLADLEVIQYNASGTQLEKTTIGYGDISTSGTNRSINCNANTTRIRFNAGAYLGYSYTISNVQTTRNTTSSVSVNSLSYSTDPGQSLGKQITVTYSNIPVFLSFKSDEDAGVSSGKSLWCVNTSYFGGCGKKGSQNVTVTFQSNTKGNFTDKLYVRNNVGTLLHTIDLSASVTAQEQFLKSWNIADAYNTTDQVTLQASTTVDNTDFTFTATTSNPANIVSISNAGVMTFSGSGTATIRAYQPGDAMSQEFETTHNITVNKVSPNITNPTGKAIEYRSALKNSTWEEAGVAKVTLRGVPNTVVAGSFGWNDSEHVVMDAAGEHSYKATFTPSDGGMYNNVEYDQTITILRTAQTLTMNNGTVKVAVGGIDEGADDSKLDLDGLINTQTADVVNAVKRDGVVTYEVISENKANASIGEGNIFSATVIGDYRIRATKAQTDWYNVVTKDFTVTVEKRANTLMTAGPYTKYVDDEVEGVATQVNSDGKIQTSSSDATVAYYDVANNKIVIPNSEAKSFDQKEITIKIWQDATVRFEGIAEADAKTITLTVKKYDNAFSCSWGSWTKRVNFEDVFDVDFTTNNSDYTNSPIEITQTSGETIATLVKNDNTHSTITASYNRGDAKWTISQAENYKFKGATKAGVTVKVRVLPAVDCYLFEDNTEHSFSTGITDFSGHYDPAIAVSGPVKQISFDAKKSRIDAISRFIVQYSVDNGNNWRTIDSDINLSTSYKTFGPYDFPNLQASEKVTHIRFGAETGGTYGKSYKNIKISRTTSIKPEDEDGNLVETLVMPQNTVGGTTTAKFYMNFSSCDDMIKVVSNNSHFTVDQPEISVDHTKDYDHADVTVTYSSDAKGTHTGTITIYTKYQYRTFTVTGTTDKKIQNLTWKESFAGAPLILPVGLTVDNINIAAEAPSGNSVIYSTNAPEIIKITLGGLGFEVVGEGTAELTASAEGDDVWLPVSETKTVNATGKKIQVIVWEQDLMHGLKQNDQVNLIAKVYIRDMKTGSLTYNEERTSEITYSCPSNTVISLNNEDKQITILNYGQTTITANVEGSENYDAALPVTVYVKVRQPSAGCETPLVLNQTEAVQLFSMNMDLTNWTTPLITSEPIFLDPANGKPDKLSYQHNGELYVYGLIKLCRGTIKAQQRVNGIWEDIEGSEYNNGGKEGSEGAYDWRLVEDLQLDENADAIRFIRLTAGQGYHNFRNIQITLKQYLRQTSEDLDLGDIQIGEARPATIGFDYSDVKGDVWASKANTEDASYIINTSVFEMECGEHGHKDLPITITPTALGPWSATIIIEDQFTHLPCTLTVKANVVTGISYIFNGSEGEKGTEWGENTNWEGSNTPGANDAVLVNSDVVITGNVTVGSMTISDEATVTVTVTGKLNLGSKNSALLGNYGNLHIEEGGEVNVGSGALLVNDFILDAKLGDADNAAASGQLSDEEQKLVVMNDAYFKMSFDVSGQITYGWYDFVVPFEVDAKNGVFDANGVQIVYGTDYIIMSHSEEKRARNQKAWSTFTGTLEPGRIYTITFEETKTWNTFLFKKKDDSDLVNNGTYTSAYSSTIGESQDRGWNGFGNGTLQHRELTDLTGISKVQMYNHTYNRYDVVDDVDWSTKALAVGTAFSIQVLGEQSIVLTEADAEKPLRAPKMDNSRIIEEFYLTLTDSETAKMTDRLWVSASEEATGEYVIGRDLLKMGTPTQAKVAQMWAINNNLTLCDIEMPFVSEQASCALGLFAPKAGSYELMIERAPEDADLYLTYNDQIIWNLTASPYVFDLAKGTTEGYGLRIVARAPQIATGVDEANADSKSVRKVVINDKIYIITPEGEMYDIVGKSVKF